MFVSIPTAICPQCGVERRVSEQFAFGVDRLRMTLATCGHVVPRSG